MKVQSGKGLFTVLLFFEMYETGKRFFREKLSDLEIFLRADEKSLRFDQIITGLKSCMNDLRSEKMFRQQLVEYYQNERLLEYECRSLIRIFEIELNNNPVQIETVIGRKLLDEEERTIFHDCVFSILTD